MTIAKSFLFHLLIIVTTVIGQSQDFRLPNSLVPTHYDLQMQPILDESPGYTRFTAPGKVTITVNCTEETDSIKVHALDLKIVENATKVVGTGGALQILAQGFELEHHFFVIALGEKLVVGEVYQIYIEFITPVSQTRLDGMYLDQYVDPRTNQTKYVSTTLFAAINARRCFPCFDEPQLKAVFSISLGRREGYHSLSNMHQISTQPMPDADGWYLDQFAPSLPMSTYLVAMIVSDMTYEQAVVPLKAGNNATIRVYAPYYFIDRGGGLYAANQTKNVLSKFDTYFNSSFMLQKLDSVSLPRFYFSAMENWALITYNDRVLLYFPGESTEQERYRITSIIAHEVVHHYFGNLVTCQWWTWIWLNEGGATYFSHLGVEMTYPEFNPWDRFINDVYQVALEFDASPATHPVANEPRRLEDIGGVYDDIAYEKGASLIRMMRSFLTEPVIQTGIRRYINEKQFKNARQDDLFQILEETALQQNKSQVATVKEIMDTWTLQSGFPLVQVTRLNSTHVQFTQQKFALSSPKNSEEKWWIPISIEVIVPSKKEYFLWISNQQNATTFPIPESEVFVVNSRSEGYYRTMYSRELFENLLKLGGNCEGSLSSTAKANILDDYITFEEDLTSPTLEKMMNTFQLEKENLLVWETILKHYTRKLLETYKTKNFTLVDKLKKFMMENLQGKMTCALKRLEVNNDIGEGMMLRSELLFWTCLLHPSQPHCFHQTKENIERWKSSQSPFQADFEDTYFCVAASSLGPEVWDRMYTHMKMKRELKMPCGYARVLSSLACTSDESLFQKIYPKILTEFKELTEVDGISKVRISAENLPVIRAALRLVFNEPMRHLILNELA